MAHQDQTSQKPFRVIVVGAGLVGLSLSHALQLANIDHVVLEKHSEIVSIHGAALVRQSRLLITYEYVTDHAADDLSWCIPSF
jgi:2-polyprenyl-6-methoxyphenol hydroxylase-like FAD-dependent oxidoreductase